MKKTLILFGIVSLIVFSSCTKKAADMIVGNWSLRQKPYYYDDYYYDNSDIWEFNSDGTFRYETDGNVYEGIYVVKGPNIRLSFGNHQKIATITNMSNDQMRWVFDNGSSSIIFTRTNRFISGTPSSDGYGEETTYYINATADPFNGGHVYGEGVYEMFENCVLEAAAKSSYRFDYWTENGNVVSYDSHYSFIVTRDRHLVANFSYY